MARTIHLRVHGAADGGVDGLVSHFDEQARSREWRSARPRLATAASPDLFSMEYFRHAAAHEATEHPELGPLLGTAFLEMKGDECDALALLFIARDCSERLGVTVTLTDRDNPIAKLRQIELRRGRLPDGAQLEAILVARPIYKRLPRGVIEMYPPRALGSAFGVAEHEDAERRNWSFLVHGMRDNADGFLEAEAEAMRIYRGLRGLP